MQQPWFSTTVLLVGRFLLGLYFILPGISKITGFEATSAYMAAHGMQMIPVFLVLTIVLQIGGGIALIVGAWTRIVAFVLAGLVLVISIVMHDFWNFAEGMERAHETQNFVKNLAVMAGILVLSGHGAGPVSWDARRAQRGSSS